MSMPRPVFFSRGVNALLEGTVLMPLSLDQEASSDDQVTDATPQADWEQLKSITIAGVAGRRVFVKSAQAAGDLNGSVLMTGHHVAADLGFSLEKQGAAAKTAPDEGGEVKRYTSDGGPQTFTGCLADQFGGRSWQALTAPGSFGDGVIVRYWMRLGSASQGAAATAYCIKAARVLYGLQGLVQHRGNGF